MEIGFVWDEKKYQTVVKEHNVITAYDAEERYQDEYYQRQRRDV